MRNLVVLVATLGLLVLLAFSMRISPVVRLDSGWEYAEVAQAGGAAAPWRPIAHAATFAGARGRPLQYRVTVPGQPELAESWLFLQWVEDSFSVWRDGREIFRSPGFDAPGRERTDRHWWLLPLGHLERSETLRLEVRPASSSVPAIAGLPLLGARHEIMRAIFTEELYKIAVSSLSIFFGLMILVFFLSSRQSDRTWLALSIMAIFFGMWVMASAATRMRLFLFDGQAVWLALDHYSLYVFGMLLMRCYSLMVSPGPFGICHHYGRLALVSLPLVLLASAMGWLPVLDVLPIAQGLLTLGAVLALVDSVWSLLMRRKRLTLVAAGMGTFAMCGLHDVLMDVGLIAWGPQLTPFAGLVVIFALGSIIANNYWRTQERLASAQGEAEKEHLRALHLETEQRLRDAEHEAQIQRSREEHRLRSLNAMLSLSDRFNSPVTGILNHAELLLRKLPKLRDAVNEHRVCENDLVHFEVGLEQLRSSANELRRLSSELVQYRESTHAVHAGDLDLRKNLREEE